MSDISCLPPYEGIRLAAVRLIQSPPDAAAACAILAAADVIGFDTESKPTFAKGEESQGPHLIQLATDDEAFLFPVGQLSDLGAVKAILESEKILKVGFGLGDDVRRLKSKLGICPAHVLDLSRALREEERNDLGAKTAVAKFFGTKLQKSKRISTTNWANPRFTERQILYAADDAQVPLRVYRAWLRRSVADDCR